MTLKDFGIFLRLKNPLATKRTGETIVKGLQALGTHSHVGRLVEYLPDQYREWRIDFGDIGYFAGYRFDEERVTVLALRHQKEFGF